jgi:hypothetical protein
MTTFIRFGLKTLLAVCVAGSLAYVLLAVIALIETVIGAI